MIEETAQKLLGRWGMVGARLTLIAERENIVFRADHHTGQYALRVHRPGYQSTRMISSELAWMTHLLSMGLCVPEPVLSRDGALVVEVDGYDASLLTWLKGDPLGETGQPLCLADRCGTFEKMGRLMAELHQISDDWHPPEGFERKSWDIDGLLGESPLWGRFWENPQLTKEEHALFSNIRSELREDLSKANLDYGLIHADMLRENVLVNGEDLGLIDFDDGGYGFRLFDVATALLKNRDEADYEQLATAFINGYRMQRPLDTSFLPQIMLIRSLTYLGWIIPRMNEKGSEIRQKRFLETSRILCSDFLSGQRTPGA